MPPPATHPTMNRKGRDVAPNRGGDRAKKWLSADAPNATGGS